MNTDRIEKKILLRAPRQRVWRALADSTEFGTWFGMKFEGPFVAGRSIRGVVVTTQVDPEVAKLQKPYEGLEFEITIEQMEPESLFSLRWHPNAVERGVDYSKEPTTTVEFRLQEAPEGTLLTVVESGFQRLPATRQRSAFDSNSGGWEEQLKNIERYVTEHPSPRG